MIIFLLKKIRVNTSYSRNKNAQIAAKKILQKYKNISRKKAPLPFNINDVADAETIDCNNHTDINDVSSSESAQVELLKKLLISIKKLRKNKAPLPFNINDTADTETVD